ncbi:RING-H2 finger protein ATL81 [Diplonema papillatum]|nr:RING-H2 finger protein ATL81 [Diplonema papillatum]
MGCGVSTAGVTTASTKPEDPAASCSARSSASGQRTIVVLSHARHSSMIRESQQQSAGSNPQLLRLHAIHHSLSHALPFHHAHSFHFQPSLKPKPMGVSQQELEDHTVVSQLAKTESGVVETEECPMCLETYLAGDSIRTASCGHYFHTTCIDGWLQRSQLCPMCCQPVTRPSCRAPSVDTNASSAHDAADAHQVDA